MKLELIGWARTFYVHKLINRPLLMRHACEPAARRARRETEVQISKRGNTVSIRFHIANLSLNGNYGGAVTLSKREAQMIAALFEG